MSSAVLPTAAALATLYAITRIPGFLLAKAELACICIVAIFVAGSFRVSLATRAKRKAAKLAGARLPAVIEGFLPANLDVLIKFGHSWVNDWPGTFVDAAFKQFASKTVNVRLLYSDRYLTADHAIMKHMLTSNRFPIWGKGSEFHEWFDTFLGSGIFNSDPGDLWKWHRTLMRPHFEKSKISDLNTFDRHADELLDHIAEECGKGNAVDCQDLLGRFALDTATEFLMGGSVNSLQEVKKATTSPSSKSSSFVAAFTTLQTNAVFRSRYPGVWRFFELFGTADKRPMRIVTPLINEIIKATMERKEVNEKLSDYEHVTLVDLLVTKTSDMNLIRDAILNILLASKDTMTSLLTSTLYMLCKHPAIYAEARAEVLSICGKATPTYEDIKALKYLRAIINETLRLFPPIPFNVRSPSEDDVLPGGLFIPAGTTVTYSIWSIQRSTELWGSDAGIWDPERWKDPTKRLQCMIDQPFIFQPFSAGPRICLGQNFAYNEATVVLAKLMQRFSNVEVARDVQPKNSYVNNQEDMILPQSQITLIWKGGMWIRLKTDKDSD